MSSRTCTILVLSLAVLASGSLGTSNGVVLRVNDEGNLAPELPRLSHAHRHAAGADHDSHDHREDADHADLHDLMASCSDSLVSGHKLERSSSSLAIHQHHLSLELCLPTCFQTGPAPGSEARCMTVPTFRGGTAHMELACLASVVLLV